MDGIYSLSLCATRNGRRERGRAADVAGQVRGLEVGEIERPGRTIGQHKHSLERRPVPTATGLGVALMTSGGVTRSG